MAHGVLCPPGTYGLNLNKIDETACLPCPEGRFCFHYGTTETEVNSDALKCSAGYICGQGNVYQTPSEGDGNNGDSGQCEPGHYCPLGTIPTGPVKCPIARVKNEIILVNRLRFLSMRTSTIKKFEIF